MNDAMFQAGHMRFRSQGATDDTLFLYVEWKQPGYQRDIVPLLGAYFVSPPRDSETHSYEIEFDDTTQRWRSLYDGSSELLVELESWTIDLGRWAAWSTEINKRETDMPGTSIDPCVISDCSYRSGGPFWTTVSFQTGRDTVRCSGIAGNQLEWDIHGSHDSPFIWDVHPLAPPKKQSISEMSRRDKL